MSRACNSPLNRVSKGGIGSLLGRERLFRKCKNGATVTMRMDEHVYYGECVKAKEVQDRVLRESNI